MVHRKISAPILSSYMMQPCCWSIHCMLQGVGGGIFGLAGHEWSSWTCGSYFVGTSLRSGGGMSDWENRHMVLHALLPPNPPLLLHKCLCPPRCPRSSPTANLPALVWHLGATGVWAGSPAICIGGPAAHNGSAHLLCHKRIYSSGPLKSLDEVGLSQSLWYPGSKPCSSAVPKVLLGWWDRIECLWGQGLGMRGCPDGTAVIVMPWAPRGFSAYLGGPVGIQKGLGCPLPSLQAPPMLQKAQIAHRKHFWFLCLDLSSETPNTLD